MARYLETAAKAAEVLDSIMECLKDHPDREHILSQTIYLYNLGIRTAPRATQSTVRLNAIRVMAKNQPAKISMVEKKATSMYKGNYTYKAIRIETAPHDQPYIVEDGADADTTE
jgi:hypothetical protein